MANREDQKLQIQEATDLVALIGEHVALQRKGREFVGLCPFHDDHSPSMTVSAAKQIFKCFSCGAGGDVFTWMTRYQRMTFPEAIKFLAERAGIVLQHDATRRLGPDGTDPRRKILEANQRAMDIFCSFLRDPRHGRTAREYLETRSIQPQTAETFHIGYAPDGWDGLLKLVAQRGWDKQDFERAGLILPRQDGSGHYDRFRHRLIFPILDNLGRPIAFGARRLREQDDPKYLNSPESPVFDKSSTLYGLAQARRQIIADRTAVIVEGYTDVTACHQAGISNVVATLGTSLTAGHVRQMRHLAEKVVLIFDPDTAGQQAADRAVEAFLQGDLDVAVCVLPDALDPADLMLTPQGPQRWQAAVDSATDALEYQFGRVSDQLEQADTIAGRQRVAEDYLRRLAGLGLERQNPIRRGLILQKLTGLLKLDEQQITRLLRQHARPARPAARADSDNEKSTQEGEKSFALAQTAPRMLALQLAERQLIGAILHKPKLFDHTLGDGTILSDAVTAADMVTRDARRLYGIVHERLRRDNHLVLKELLAELGSQSATGDATDDVTDCVTAMVDLATGAEAEIDQLAQGNDDHLVAALRGAAEAIRGHHRDGDYARARQELAASRVRKDGTDDGNRNGNESDDKDGGENSNQNGQDRPHDETDLLLRDMVEKRKANRRPSFIGRARTT